MTEDVDILFPVSPEREYPTGATPKHSPVHARRAASAQLAPSANKIIAELERANRAMVQEVRALKKSMLDRLSQVESHVEASHIRSYKSLRDANQSLDKLARNTLSQTLEIAQLKAELREAKNELDETKQRLSVLEEAMARTTPSSHELPADLECQYLEPYPRVDDHLMHDHEDEVRTQLTDYLDALDMFEPTTLSPLRSPEAGISPSNLHASALPDPVTYHEQFPENTPEILEPAASVLGKRKHPYVCCDYNDESSSLSSVPSSPDPETECEPGSSSEFSPEPPGKGARIAVHLLIPPSSSSPKSSQRSNLAEHKSGNHWTNALDANVEWPEKLIGEEVNRDFIVCDGCELFYHWSCVAVNRDDPRVQPDVLYFCPRCEYKKNIGKKIYKSKRKEKVGICAHPNCDLLQDADFYAVDYLIGRRHLSFDGQEITEYLVKWTGWAVGESTWTAECDITDELLWTFHEAALDESFTQKILESNQGFLLQEALDHGFRLPS